MLDAIRRVCSEGFRVFFLSAALFGLFAGVVWGLLLARPGIGGGSFAMAPYLWHSHEMIFGYAGAAIGGFFLTAVPNWTGMPGARTVFITGAALVWLGGRVAMWYSGLLPAGLVAAVDLAFVPILASKIASQLIKRPKPQNLMFLLFLLAVWVSNLMTHLEWTGLTGDTAFAGLRGGLLAVCAMIVVLGGRITPAFTRNAMKRAGVPENRWPVSVQPVERAAVIGALVLPWLAIVPPVPGRLAGAVALGLGVVQAVRLARWRGLWTLNQPILWSLHLGLSLLALGLVLWGAAQWGIGGEVAAVHMLGIGCVGTMTLAVMSRAALGHSGRALVAPRPVAVAYGLMVLAALARWAGAAADGLYLPLMELAAGLWSLAFVLFVLALWPALTGPKVTTRG
ncbi:NnrS family protein [Seohaeicola saemankumensis]|nr:NnrS family protein [Seohaeicola saemankumensis]MCA0872486.1 NnrS family protein [Seohaeicola saemankumensis]